MTATEIVLPQLGVEMTSAVLAEWAVADGAEVGSGDTVAVVETDKVSFEIEAPLGGILRIEATAGSEYRVGDRLGVLVDGSAPPPATPPPTPPPTPPTPPDGRVLATPLIRRLAADRGIDLRTVTGSGPGGRIRRPDIDAVLATVPAAVPAEPPAVAAPGRSLSPLRRTIAERMVESLRTTAQMTDVREVEVSALVALRTELAAKAERLGFRVSLTDLLLKATALALRENPLLNATMEGERLVEHDRIHLGIAVARDDGLLVPVLRDADRLSLRAVHDRGAALAAAVRDRTIDAAGLAGGTFTVTNIGSYGSHYGTPVLNAPQVAVLATGAVLDRPVVRDGAVVAGKVLHLSLTVDHRVVDGAAAGRFQNSLAELLGEPDRILVG